MQVKLEKPGLLVKAVELISEFVSEVKFKLDDSGMSVLAIDPANVALVRFCLVKNAFTQFDLGNTDKIVLGVNLDDFKKILKRAGPQSTLILSHNENRLNIEIQDRIKRNFTLNLIEIDQEDKEMPNLEFSSFVEMNSLDFIDAIEDCSVVDDACSFIIKEGKFIIEAKNLNSARLEFSGEKTKIEAEDCKSRYSLEYLQKFIKGSKLCEKTDLHFANDNPLKMDLKMEYMEINFILAPRVETED